MKRRKHLAEDGREIHYAKEREEDSRRSWRPARALLERFPSGIAAVPGAGVAGEGYHFFAIEHGRMVRIVALEIWPSFFREQERKVSGKKKR